MSGMEIIKKGTDLIYVLPTFQDFATTNTNDPLNKKITEMSLYNTSNDISIAKLTGRQNTFIISNLLQDLKNMGFKTAILFSHGTLATLELRDKIYYYKQEYEWQLIGGLNCPISIVNLESITNFNLLDDNTNEPELYSLLDRIYFNATSNNLDILYISQEIKQCIDYFDKNTYIENNKPSDIYLTDTDGLLESPPSNMNIDILICPASGINQFILASKNLHTLKKIIWTDFSKPSINWIKHVVNNWDGNNYKQFVKDNIELLNNDMITFLDYEYYDNMPDFDWKKFQSIEHIFLNIDLINEYDKVVAYTQDSNILLHITNIFIYEINHILNGSNQVYISYIDYLDKLINKNTNIYVKGKDPFGTSIKYKNVSKYGIL